MSKSDLILLKEKFNTSSFFVEVVDSLFDKLVEFEYLSTSKAIYFMKKLLSNINELKIGMGSSYDYKSGFYDANKKELYIKDEKDIPSVYLRILYALTTSEIDTNIYMSGYSKTRLRKDSYKLEHSNFGINRAVIANLVYKLCSLIPAELQITPTATTYTHNFLGFKIESANDIYALEGKILSEMCFVLDLDPELLYSGLFTKNPIKYLDNILLKKRFDNKDKFLRLFDNISRKYNTYNKLAFLSQKLNDNYIEYKKHVLNDNVDDIKKEQEIIEEHISSTIASLYGSVESQDNEDFEFSINLSEALERLENELTSYLIAIQDILAEQLIKSGKSLPNSKYASKLKCFNNILIAPNKKVIKTIENTILFELMPSSEVTEINLIKKIKYAIIEQILSSQDFASISNTFSFYNITSLEDSDIGTALILLNSEKRFSKIVEVKGLNNNISDYAFELNYIPLDNLKYIMNTNYSEIYVENIELLFTSLRDSFKEFSKLYLDNIFAFSYLNKKYLVIYCNDKTYIVCFNYFNKEYNFNMLSLSEQYKVFGNTKSNTSLLKSTLPTIYKK